MPTSGRRPRSPALGKKVVINCTGYGARALWKDDTLVPVRAPDRAADPASRGTLWLGLTQCADRTAPRRARGPVVRQRRDAGLGRHHEAPDRADAEQAVRHWPSVHEERLTASAQRPHGLPAASEGDRPRRPWPIAGSAIILTRSAIARRRRQRDVPVTNGPAPQYTTEADDASDPRRA